MKCPYCNHSFMPFEQYCDLHAHLIKCSKEYIDTHLLKYYIREDTSYLQPMKKPERRTGKGRRKVNPDRRQNDRTLWYTQKDSPIKAYSGYYMDKHFDPSNDRRKVCAPLTRRIKTRRKCDL